MEIKAVRNEVQYECGIYILTGKIDGEEFIKVGKATAGLDRRLNQINAECYGGTDQWALHTWFQCNAERMVTAIERMAHDELETFKVKNLTNGSGGRATEIFDVDPAEAGDRIREMMLNIGGEWRLDVDLTHRDGVPVDYSAAPPPKRVDASLEEKVVGIVVLASLGYGVFKLIFS